MKNKKLTYFLILLLVIVWGLIIYRVIAAAGGSDGDLQPTPVLGHKETYNDYAVPKDTTRLLLNYRDPFGLVVRKDTSKPKVKQRQSSGKLLPGINWSLIKYAGYLRNPGSKKLITILSINGKSASMSEGETVDHVKLIQNKVDSVKVLFSGKTKFIPLHQ